MKKKITVEEFKELIPKLKGLSRDTLDILKGVWVDGKSQTEMAEEYNITRQSVSKMVQRANRIIEKAPVGWVKFEGFMPPEMLKEINSRLELLLKERG